MRRCGENKSELSASFPSALAYPQFLLSCHPVLHLKGTNLRHHPRFEDNKAGFVVGYVVFLANSSPSNCELSAVRSDNKFGPLANKNSRNQGVV